MSAWRTRPALGLESAIAEFKAALPGWWLSTCEGQVSCDASCAPTVESEHIALIERDRRFTDGFHVDLMADALAAVAAAGRGQRIETISRSSSQLICLIRSAASPARSS